MNFVPLSPNRTVVTSFSAHRSSRDCDEYERGAWVLHVASSASQDACCVALSDGSIHVYSTETLQPIKEIAPHKIQHQGDSSNITDMCFPLQNLVVTSCRGGNEGLVRVFDVRASQQSAVVELSLPRKEEALSVSIGYDGALAAVGSSKAHVHFFDLRNLNNARNGISSNNGGTQILGSYVDAHTEEVTRVRFQPSNDGNNSASTTTPLLLTASEDGLACIFDTAQATEEMALKSVLNVQSPLREVGFFGPAMEGVYCLTGSETMSVWHHDSAQRICDFGGLDLRSKLSSQMGDMMGVVFLVNCHWDTRAKQLSLLTGNSGGDSALFRVEATSISLTHTLSGGHKGCVRSFAHLNSGTILTGGEDARLCEWILSPKKYSLSTSAKTVSRSLDMSQPTMGGGPVRRTPKKMSAAPY